MGTTASMYLWYLLHTALGFLSMWLFARDEVKLSRAATFVASLAWAFSGFHQQHYSGGHFTFVPFLYFPFAVLLWRRAAGDLRYAVGPGCVIVSPDSGRVKVAERFAKHLDADVASVYKRRSTAKVNSVEALDIMGEVAGRTCVIMDDMVDTANTLCKAATALKEHGARKVVAYCTHPVLSGGAVARIASSDMDEIVVTDTIPLSEEARACPRIRQLSCAQLIAETITRISNEESVSSLFID